MSDCKLDKWWWVEPENRWVIASANGLTLSGRRVHALADRVRRLLPCEVQYYHHLRADVAPPALAR